MLYIEGDGSVRLTRGDTARLSVSIVDEITGEPYEVCETDELRLTVKKSIKDSSYCFQKKVTGSSDFYIKPVDTNHLSFGRYVYDVELTTDGGDVFTVIEPSTFEIMQEVTY